MNTVNNKISKIFKIENNCHERMVKYHEKHLKVQYKKALDRIRLDIAKMYESGVEASFSEMSKYNRLTNLENQIAGELKVLSKESIKTTKTAIVDSYQQSYYFGGYAGESSLNMRMGFGMLDKSTIDAAILNPYDRIKWTERSAQGINRLNQRIRESVTQGLIQGQSYQQMTSEIKNVMGKSAYEKFRIVRTEGGRAQSMGRLNAYEKAKRIADEENIKTNKQWVATLDTRTRPRHASLDGKIADKDGMFHQDGISTPAPRLSGVPGFDINCRCTTIMQFTDIPYKVRRENIGEKDIINFSSFKTWAKEKGIKENIFRQKYNF